MPSPVQQRLFLVSKSKVLQPIVLSISARAEVLFIDGWPWALYDGEIFFPDLSGTMPRSLVEMIHKFWGREIPQTRLPPEQFDFMLVSAMSRSLRPLLRRLNGEPDQPQVPSRPQAGQEEGSRPEGQTAPSSGQHEATPGS